MKNGNDDHLITYVLYMYIATELEFIIERLAIKNY